MILSPREKIIKLRKEYKITQEQLSSLDLKRQFIGMIEIGKRGLTEKTAEIICRNFNDIFRKRKINKEITVQFLLETREEQAIKKLNLLIKNLNLNTKEIEPYFYELSEKNKKIFSKLFGKVYLELNELKKSRKYFEIFLGLIKENEKIEIGEVLLILTRIYYYFGEFLETKKMVEKYFENLKNINETIKNKILYNYSYSLYKLKNINESLSELKFILKYNKDLDLDFKIQNLMAIIYYSEKKQTKKSLKIYEKLLVDQNYENKLVIYGNYLQIWLENKKFIDSEEIIKQILDILEKYNTSEEHEFKLYLLIAKTYKELNQKEKAYSYYKLALKTNDRNKLLIEKKYETLIKMVQDYVLDNDKIDEIVNIFLIIFNQEKNYEKALKFIKNIKNEKKQLFLLTKI